MASPDTAPKDRIIEVRTRADRRWRLVRWKASGVTEVAGIATVTGCWESRESDRFTIPPLEVTEWREPVHPASWFGTPKDWSGA